MSEPCFCYPVGAIRFGEFDAGGVLYHANYFHVYEAARESFLESIGYPYPALAADRIHFPLVESHQNFLQPIRYGDNCQLDLRASQIKASSFRLDYDILVIRNVGQNSQPPQLVHQAWTRLVYVKATEGIFRPQRLPDYLRSGLEGISGTQHGRPDARAKC